MNQKEESLLFDKHPQETEIKKVADGLAELIILHEQCLKHYIGISKHRENKDIQKAFIDLPERPNLAIFYDCLEGAIAGAASILCNLNNAYNNLLDAFSEHNYLFKNSIKKIENARKN